MREWFDPEYDRIVDDIEVRRQYDFFKDHGYFSRNGKTFEKFADENLSTCLNGMKRKKLIIIRCMIND